MEKEPPHPGEILLREFIEPNGLMPHRLAKDLGWPYSKLEKLMDGEINLTVDSAMELAEVLDMEPDFWVSLHKVINVGNPLIIIFNVFVS